MKKEKFIPLKRKLGIIIGLGIFLSSLILITYSVLTTRKESVQAAENQAKAIASDFSADIQIQLEEAMDASRAVANMLSPVGNKNMHGKISRESAVLMGEKVLFSNPDFLGLTLAFDEQAFDSRDKDFINKPAHDATGRFLSYLTKGENNKAVLDVLIDYETQEKGPWYWEPKLRMTDYITEPVVYPVQGVDVTMVSCMTPIINDGVFLGVTGIDYPIDFMQKKACEGDYFGGNFQMCIISNEGVYAANKNYPERVNVSLKEFFPDSFDKKIEEIKSGVSSVEIEDGFLYVKVPLYIAKTGVTWQVNFSVPEEIIFAQAKKQMYMQWLIGLICIIIGILIVILYVSKLIKPVESMVHLAESMASGDLKTNMNLGNSNDEIGKLSQSFNKMRQTFIQIASQIRDSSEQIAAASGQLSSTSVQLSQSASEQASSLEEISSTMEEIASNIANNTSNATQTSQYAIKSSNEIEHVNEASQESLEAVQDISQKISIINDIAFQTNILALNAAVEAARAGEYGRGFAVVAGEVRKLAELSKNAANEIIVQTNKSVEATDKAGERLVGIVPDIQKTANMIEEIVASSIEQNNGVDQVNSAIQQLNYVTQQNAAASEEMAASSEELSAQAENLKKYISFFKL